MASHPMDTAWINSKGSRPQSLVFQSDGNEDDIQRSPSGMYPLPRISASISPLDLVLFAQLTEINRVLWFLQGILCDLWWCRVIFGNWPTYTVEECRGSDFLDLLRCVILPKYQSVNSWELTSVYSRGMSRQRLPRSVTLCHIPNLFYAVTTFTKITENALNGSKNYWSLFNWGRRRA